MNDVANHQERSLSLVEVMLAPGWEEDFLHLLECVQCRTVVAARLREAALLAGGGEPDYGPLLYDLELSLPGYLRAFEEKSAEAQRLYERLMETPGERRGELAAAPEMRNLQVAEMLLRGSASAAPREAGRSRELALLALAIAEQFGDAEEGWAVDVRIAAWSRLGDVERRQGNWAAAEGQLARAGRAVATAPQSAERATYCRLLGHLRREQGNVDEAAGLLWRAASFFNLLAAGLEAGRCYSELGFLLLEEDPEQALLPLHHALNLFEREKEAGLEAVARYGLVLGYAMAGRHEAAFRELGKASGTGLRAVTRGADVRWILSLEGRALALLGDEDSAARLLDTAREAHVQAGEYHEAALAVVDLTVARVAIGGPLEADGLLRDFEDAQAGVRERARCRVLGRFLGLAASRALPEDLEKEAVLAKRRLRRLRAEPEAVLAELGGEAA